MTITQLQLMVYVLPDDIAYRKSEGTGCIVKANWEADIFTQYK